MTPANPVRISGRLLPLAVAILLCAPAAHAQLAHKGPAAAIALSKTLAPYDISFVKQNKSEEQAWRLDLRDNVFTATHASLIAILSYVYDINGDRITGLTGPVASLNFDVTAKVLPSADGIEPKFTDLQLSAMMIPLLADRFRLKAHVQPKIAPVYDLVVAKGGAKIKIDQSEQGGGDWNIKSTSTEKLLTGKSASIDNLADVLSDVAGRKVIDKTGLSDHADITLRWSDDVALTQGDANAISIFTALEEQLGLKLQPSKGPVDILVIDHVEMPSEN
jgi:bla regulator protein BlaR1